MLSSACDLMLSLFVSVCDSYYMVYRTLCFTSLNFFVIFFTILVSMLCLVNKIYIHMIYALLNVDWMANIDRKYGLCVLNRKCRQSTV